MAKTYEPALDGLRALATLMVLGHHAVAPGFDGGFIGVDLFFVLSGCLITSLLLAERERTGTIDYTGFLLRRLRRLAPALGLMVATFLAVAPVLFPGQGLAPAFAALLYVSDFTKALSGLGGSLTHTWSLSAEMKFYLLWPAVLMLPRRWLPGALLALFVIATGWRVHCALDSGWRPVYFRLDTHASGLILGALLATLRLSGPAWWSYVGLAGLVSLSLILNSGDVSTLVWGLTAAELSSALLLLGVRAGAMASIFCHPLAVRCGVLSYGIYLWHAPAADYFRPMGWATCLAAAAAIGLLGAWVSYWTVERAFRQASARRLQPA